MRWQTLDVLPPLDELVLIWVDDLPTLARRTDGFSDSPHWAWVQDGYHAAHFSSAQPDRWAVIQPPIL